MTGRGIPASLQRGRIGVESPKKGVGYAPGSLVWNGIFRLENPHYTTTLPALWEESDAYS